MRIIGIDPGSNFTGYGLIESDGRDSKHLHSGVIRVQGENLPEKLGMIFREVAAIVEEYRPEQMAIENVFVSKNAGSALKLGQARGAAICAGVQAGLEVHEYSPRAIKQGIVGTGAADKDQVQHMVRMLLGFKEKLQSDRADALAIALCHAHTHQARTNSVWSQIQ
jgi:crossover junction endodeoxyribonuclease RuvC